METIRREGKSEFEIVTSFMKEFKIGKDDFTYRVIEKGSSGFFNLFGSKVAVVEFFLNSDNNIKKFLSDILDMMNVTYTEIEINQKKYATFANISGVAEKGFVIGREGRILDSLQHLAQRMLMNKGSESNQVVVDVDGYRQKHEQILISKVKHIAEKVKERKKSITMDPLSAADRKIIHKFIEKDSTLRTLTVGDGEKKRVVIMLDNGSSDQKRNNRSGNRQRSPRSGSGQRSNYPPRRRPRPDRRNNNSQKSEQKAEQKSE